MDTQVVPVPTPLGPGRALVDTPSLATTAVLLGHGAGGNAASADLMLLARVLPALGVAVVRFEQPWKTAGRRMTAPPPALDVGWRAAVAWLRDQAYGQGRLFFGGRSSGARVACRTAPEFPVLGVVCLAFPLHLPGRAGPSRLPELLTPTVPRLVLQGSRDAFGGSAELVAALGDAPGVEVVELPGADHGYRIAADAAFGVTDLRATLTRRVADFVSS